jgi:DNA adenine methylase
LFRVNARGAFNVPAGRYDRPRIADRARLMAVADALAAPGVTLAWGSFELAMEIATPGDFLYFDPPYAPVSRTANFTNYTTMKFAGPQQERLQEVVLAVARRGCSVLLSNSTAGEIVALYDDNPQARSAGLRALRVTARRAVNSNAARRGPVDEYLITNV